jgi:hypothetical protein
VVLEAEWGLTENEAATITSCAFVGAMLGTLTLGPLGDTLVEDQLSFWRQQSSP